MSGPARLLTAASLAAGLVTFAVGCGGGGAATPEEAFKNAQAAVEKEDWKTFCGTMTAESQDVFAGGMAMGGMMMQAFAGLGGEEGAAEAKKIGEVLAKHGITEEFGKKIEDDETIKGPEEAMKKMLEPVKDKPQFVADMMAAFKGMKGMKDQNPVNKTATLKDVKIDGDTAKATIEATIDGKTSSSPIAFKKVDGKWLMDLTETMKSGKDKGGPGTDAGFPPGGLDAPGPDAGSPPGGLEVPK